MKGNINVETVKPVIQEIGVFDNIRRGNIYVYKMISKKGEKLVASRQYASQP